MKVTARSAIHNVICMLVIGLCSGDVVKAQKSDYIWMSGYDSNVYTDSATHGYRFGNTKMNFNYSPVSVRYDSLSMNFDRTNTSFCDSNGNLLFYTNGIYIANFFDEKIENSDSLNAGYFQYEWDPTIQQNGYRLQQGIIAVQSISNTNQYYLIHSFDDVLSGGEIYTTRTLATLLDMSANNGNGKVIYKNQPLIEDTLGFELSATRHANGRDWWLLVQKRNSNCYYRILIDDMGPHLLSDSSCEGDFISDNDLGSSTFSPDGTKYIYFTVTGGLNIFNFDRCSGELSNPIHIPMDIWEDSSWFANGVAISPNSRFLYVSATKMMLQYDLWANDIPASVDTVGVYDGYRFPLNTLFFSAQSGADGKIYISCGNSVADYHVINNPDEKGAACNFEQHGVRLPTLSLCVPNFPNYRLGRLAGSACDTLTGLNDDVRAEKERILKVYPNPANDYTIIDYGFTDWNKGEVVLEIGNELGQLVYSQKLPMYSGFQKIDLTDFAAGFYTTYIKRQGTVIATSKFVKQ